MQTLNTSTASAARSRMLRPAEAAEILNVRPTTLAHWRATGTGPDFVKVGGSVRYKETDLDAFLSAGRRSSVAS